MSYSRMAFALASVMLTSLTAIVVGVALASRSSIPTVMMAISASIRTSCVGRERAETQKMQEWQGLLKGSLVREVIDFWSLHLFCIQAFSALLGAPQS